MLNEVYCGSIIRSGRPMDLRVSAYLSWVLNAGWVGYIRINCLSCWWYMPLVAQMSGPHRMFMVFTSVHQRIHWTMTLTDQPHGWVWITFHRIDAQVPITNEMEDAK